MSQRLPKRLSRWCLGALLLLGLIAASWMWVGPSNAAPPQEIHRYYYLTADHPTDGWCNECVGERTTLCSGVIYSWGEQTTYVDKHFEPCF